MEINCIRSEPCLGVSTVGCSNPEVWAGPYSVESKVEKWFIGCRMWSMRLKAALASMAQTSHRLRAKTAILVAKSRIGYVGQGLLLEPPVFVQGGENITIGENFHALDGVRLYANDGLLEVGDDCSLNSNVQLGAAHGSIRIGDRVLIGPNVVLRAADHAVVQGTAPRFEPHARGSIKVDDDVWIGANCVVTRNVSIGRFAVIGAGSIVTRDIPPYAVAVGIPARVIKYRGSDPQDSKSEKH